MRKFFKTHETDIVIGFVCLCAVILQLTVVFTLYPNL